MSSVNTKCSKCSADVVGYTLMMPFWEDSTTVVIPVVCPKCGYYGDLIVDFSSGKTEVKLEYNKG